MAKTTKKYTKLDEDRFKQIVQLLEYGLNQKKVAEIVGCSGPTVSRVHRSKAKTMADWKAFNKLEREKRAKNRPAPDTPAKDPVTPNPIATELAKAAPVKTRLSQDSVNLDRIANALERLATAWESQPAKRNIFSK